MSMIMQWILPIQTSDIVCQHYHYTISRLSVWKRQDYDLCQRTAVPVYRYLVGSADSVTDHREGGYCHSTSSQAFLARDRGRPSPPMADTPQSPSLLSWRYYRCDVSRFCSRYLPNTLESSKHWRWLMYRFKISGLICKEFSFLRQYIREFNFLTNKATWSLHDSLLFSTTRRSSPR